jgi:hypothetical protein
VTPGGQLWGTIDSVSVRSGTAGEDSRLARLRTICSGLPEAHTETPCQP